MNTELQDFMINVEPIEIIMFTFFLDVLLYFFTKLTHLNITLIHFNITLLIVCIKMYFVMLICRDMANMFCGNKD